MMTARRRFVTWFLGTSAGALVAMIVYPVVRFMTPPRVPEATTREVEAGTTQDRELIDKAFKIVRFGADPVILIHPGSPTFALSQRSVHISPASSSSTKTRA